MNPNPYTDDPTSKRFLEDFTGIINHRGDPRAALHALVRSNQAMRRAQRTSIQAIAREISEDDGMRTLFNAMIQRATTEPSESLPEHYRRALDEASTPGSTMIAESLGALVWDALALYGRWATLGVRNTVTKDAKFPVCTALPTANFHLTDASPIADDTDLAGDSVTGTAQVIAALVNAGGALARDCDLTAEILPLFEQAFNLRLDTAVFTGDGTANATYGGVTGILNFGTAATAAAGNVTIQQLDVDDVARCLETVSTRLDRPCLWWINPLSLVRFAYGVRDSNGRPVFRSALEADGQGHAGSILGYPVVLTSVLPSTNAAGSQVAIFGDGEGMAVALRAAFEFEASDMHRWDRYQRSFRAIGRAGAYARSAGAFAILTLPAA